MKEWYPVWWEEMLVLERDHEKRIEEVVLVVIVLFHHWWLNVHEYHCYFHLLDWHNVSNERHSMNYDLIDSVWPMELFVHWVFAYLNHRNSPPIVRLFCCTCNNLFLKSIEFDIRRIVEFKQLFDILFSLSRSLCRCMLMNNQWWWWCLRFLPCWKKNIGFCWWWPTWCGHTLVK